MSELKVDRAYIKRAIELADLNAVRLALYQNPGDTALAALPLAPKMSDTQREALKEQAVTWLEANAGPARLPEPPEAELRHLINLAAGEEIGEPEFQARRGAGEKRRFRRPAVGHHHREFPVTAIGLRRSCARRGCRSTLGNHPA